MSKERESHNGFEKSAAFFLEAANAALLNGQPRLAIHLFRAAFEVESAFGNIISSPVIEGLRKAWDLACELGDRSTAESVFSDLSTYNSMEQNEKAGLCLQSLAMSQLEDMGITEGDLENIAGAISQELAGFDHEDLFDSLKSMLEQLGITSLNEEADNTQAVQRLPLFLPDITKFAEGEFESLRDHGSDPDFAQDLTSGPSSDSIPGSNPGNEPDPVADSNPVTASEPAADSNPVTVPDSIPESNPSPANSSTQDPSHAASDSTTYSAVNPAPGPVIDSASGLVSIPIPDRAFEQLSPMQTGLARIGKELRKFQDRKSEPEPARRLNYEALNGYQRALAQMREFGFFSQTDEHRRSFVERAAAMHGLPKLSLDGTFLFIGSSREDVSLFAHATAGEIGLPVVQVSVDLDSQGNGVIKLSGPFKRGFFGGPPDIMDMATPCVVLIENIDYLQEMFNNEQAAIQRNGGRFKGMMPGMGRSMQAEIGGYLQALRQRPGIITMATAMDNMTLRNPLRSLLDPINVVEISPPSQEERHDVLCAFASEHPSFTELDVDRLVYFSEGISRNELVIASHTAVEQAYRESLRSGIYNRVTLEDVLVQLSSYVDHSSPLYQQIEDEVVSQFSHGLEDDMLKRQ